MITVAAWACNYLLKPFGDGNEAGKPASFYYYVSVTHSFIYTCVPVKSHILLRKILKTISAKEIAQAMKLSVSTIYKWAEPRTRNESSGIRNPLDRVALLHKVTGDKRIINWICSEADGYFIKNPKVGIRQKDQLVPATTRVVSQFAELLSVVANSAGDNRITKEESEKIRQTWETLKSTTEGFVCRCEEGNFRKLSREMTKVEKIKI